MTEENLYDDVDKININISEHCLRRYLERVKDGNYTMIGLEAETKVKNEIKKLFISSPLYYTGVIGNSKNPVCVHCNRNGWTFITSQDDKTLITLYKVDLCVDSDELNQMYVDKALEKIKLFKEVYDESLSSVESKKTQYRSEIQSIESQIDEYRRIIKKLEERKQAVEKMMTSESSVPEANRIELRNALQDFIVKDKLKIEDNTK